jgi:hypothetical protein
MSSKRSRTLGARCRYRARLIREADRIFADAKEARAHAEVAEQLNALWLQAGGLFKRAAKLYRSASLGLMAHEAHKQAAYCFSLAGEEEEAADCRQRAEIIPPYCEEATDE